MYIYINKIAIKKEAIKYKQGKPSKTHLKRSQGTQVVLKV